MLWSNTLAKPGVMAEGRHAESGDPFRPVMGIARYPRWGTPLRGTNHHLWSKTGIPLWGNIYYLQLTVHCSLSS